MSVGPGGALASLERYSKDVLSSVLDIRLSLEALTQSLFVKVPGLKEEYDKRLQDAAMKHKRQVQGSTLLEIDRSIQEISQAFLEVYQRLKH